ncbi:glycosyltransferase [Oceaniglobus indicus]|uniref:glycosyltransferase n=1 Tax=Oceaniglobus indicus TaxID=2047749 RepID=UPI000C1A5A0C|nr:glycosyltransferase [Oceaniglobus indicus]
MTRIAAVVIGRNEGARLAACLDSLTGRVQRIVYVDSGSHDGSADLARAKGAEVVALEMAQPFTAARARNAGLTRLSADDTPLVQLIDGDCTLRDGWLAVATAHLDAHPQVGVVCGRRRERHPDASVYNRLCDAEWDTPVGDATACGGDALMRLAPVQAVGGFRADLIAGEEPELCLRLRRAGWTIRRLDAEMTWHDAAITGIAQWWRRSRRAGHAFAEGAALHGAGPERHWVHETRRAVFWGAILPLVTMIGALIHPGALVLLLAYPAQIARLAARGGFSRTAWQDAWFSVLGKFAEAQGIAGYHIARRRGGRGLIEYK